MSKNSAQPQPLPVGTRADLPMSELVKSPFNVRTVTRPADSIKTLAAMIEGTGGILQNLSVHPVYKNKRFTGKYGVAAGEGRYSAIQLLNDAGKFLEYLLPCTIISEEDALKISAVENYNREPMHPADEYDVFAKLINNGSSVDDVAKLFNLPAIDVKRRMKLAAIAPELMDKFRSGDLSIDVMMALATVDDHSTQVAAFNLWMQQPPYMQTPRTLKSLLHTDEVNSTDSVAVYVGEVDYVHAGGHVRDDLFSENGNGHFFCDVPLLLELATKKLQLVADDLKGEPGVAWAVVTPTYTEDIRNEYMQAPTVWGDLDPADAEQIDKLQTELISVGDQLEAYSEMGDDADEEEVSALERKYSDLDAKIGALKSKRQKVHPAISHLAGVVVTIEAGMVKIIRNLIHTEDKKDMRKLLAESSIPVSGTVAPDQKPKTPFSSPVVADLTAHRTAALQAATASNPKVAKVYLLDTMLRRLFSQFEYSVTSLAGIHLSIPYLDNHSETVKSSVASAQLSAIHEKIYNAIKQSGDVPVMDWLMGLTEEELDRMLAYGVARTIDSVETIQNTAPSHKSVSMLGGLLGINMVDYWTPTKEFFLKIPKSYTMELLDKYGKLTPEHASMKKAELADAAEAALKDSGYLPDYMTL